MAKKFINILIFLFIISLYFISFLMIYDKFRERKLASLEESAIDRFDDLVKIEEKPEEEEVQNNDYEIDFSGYTILGKIEIPRIGFTSVILKEYTYNAMNLGTVKSYGGNVNSKGGFIVSGHNFRGGSLFMYSIKNLTSGDKIYVTDTTGNRVEYTVYETLRDVSPEDTSYYTEYDGYNITLVTCEDGGNARIVVKANA